MKKVIGLLFLLFFAGSCAVFGQEAAEVPSELKTLFIIIGPFLSQYAVKYPLLGEILSVMVTARLVVKPLMSALLTIGKDTQFSFLDGVAKFSDGKVYKTIAFVLDWLLSVKLPKKK